MSHEALSAWVVRGSRKVPLLLLLLLLPPEKGKQSKKKKGSLVR